MGVYMLGLDYLLSPVTMDDFVENHHGRRALLIRGDADRFHDLFGWDDVNHYTNFGVRSYPQIKLAHETKSLGAEALAQVDYWLREGATLIINNVQTRDAVVERFVRALGRELNTRVNVNAYVSWPAKQGFDIHYDKHDVFVIAVAGEKEWKVFEPTLTYPIEQMAGPKGDPPDTDPYLACTLTKGDVLYIPRGHWHYAVAVTPSIHLTTGPQPRTAFDFLYWQLERVFKDSEFMRRDFPIIQSDEFGGRRSSEDLRAHLEEFRKNMRQSLEDESLWQQLREFVMTSNPIPRHYQMPEFVMTEKSLSEQTRFRLREEQKAVIDYDAEQQLARVLIRGYIVNVDRIPPEALQQLFTPGNSYSGQELLDRYPELEWDILRTALLTLFRYGALRVAAEPVDSGQSRQ